MLKSIFCESCPLNSGVTLDEEPQLAFEITEAEMTGDIDSINTSSIEVEVKSLLRACILSRNNGQCDDLESINRINSVN